MPMDNDQGALFDKQDFATWRNEWRGMPEFLMEDLAPYNSITLHFPSRQAMVDFAALVEQTITSRTKSVWFPNLEITRFSDKRYQDER